MSFFNPLKVSLLIGAGLVLMPVGSSAQEPPRIAQAAPEGPTYADLATLSDAAELVVRAQIRRQTTLKADRAPGVAAGFARLYIEANTVALIAGRSPIGSTLAYLVDVPLDAKGKVPRLKRQDFVLFAKPVAGRPGEVQLVSPRAQLSYTPELDARLRPILNELYAAPDQVPPRITGISDALAVPGTLTGESETQIFLATENRSPVSITVLRRPGQSPQWGVSWGEIINSAARPPVPDSLRWYRLACALPDQLPSNVNLAREPEARRLASADYAYVREAIGPCVRAITKGG
ncbi:hypothetical protein [Erythrobacter sp. R86502]|uniref:hypothetical protein n=1 Tax=Erythrobacter sp. R86502 TaxID=3093846 RepID=UPI0036D3D3BF